ncbi:MAG: hypothetical protein WCX61_05810 [Candidatus Peribacteraceae bacterium]
MPTDSSANRSILIIIIVLLSIIILGGTFTVGLRAGQFRCERDSFRQLRHMGFPDDVLGGGPPPAGRGMERMWQQNEYGFAGEVISVNDGTIVLLSRANEERTLSVDSGAIMGPPHAPQSIKNVTVGSQIVGFGEPKADGTISVRHLTVLDCCDQPEL